jgi:glycosyltransferase involved in cell wall biosynthesis
MRILLFEQWQGGHYFNYIEHLVPGLAAIADEVIVALTDVAASSERFKTQLAPLFALPNVRLDRQVQVPTEKSRLAFRLRLGRNVVEAIERSRPDYVFLPSADEQILALPLQSLRLRRLRETPVEAVIHYKAYTGTTSTRDRAVSAMQRQLLKTGVFSQLNFVNFLQYEDALARRFPWAGMARAAGDPVPQGVRMERTLARRELGIELEGRYIGMVGDLDARKAVSATIAAFRRATLTRTDRLLLAGKLAPAYARLIHDEHQDLVREGRLIVIDRFLSDTELAYCFAAIDVHSSAYNSFLGLSSLMLKSLASGVPVIVNEGGWGAAIVRRFEVGQAINPQLTLDYAASLRAALDASAQYRETPAVARLLRFHSVENFVQGIVQRAAAFAGHSPLTPVLPWSWVLEALPERRRALR